MTKSEKVRFFVSNGDYKSALRIAKTFKMWDSKEDKDAVILGHEAHSNGSFYRSLGKDPDKLIAKAVEVLKKYYGVTQ